MLGQTKENIQNVVEKVNILTAGINSLSNNHKEFDEKTNVVHKKYTERKLVLLDELFNLL